MSENTNNNPNENTEMGNCFTSTTTETTKTTTEQFAGNSNSDDNWLNQEYNVKSLSEYVPDVRIGKVVKVYDGDTITIASKPYKECPEVYKFSVRLNGIDTPEIKGSCESEIKIAKLARDRVSELVMGKIITLQNVTTEKYGRLLAEVYLGDLHLNNWLIEQRLAVFYDGGHKNSPANWELYFEGK